MKKHLTLNHFFGATLTVILWATVVPTATADDLHKRQEALAQGHARISELNELHGRYRRIRDGLVHHEKGLVAAQKSLHEQAAAWLNEWRKILNVAALVDDLSISGAAQLANRVDQLFAAQRDTFGDLVQAAALVEQKSNALQRQIDFVAVSPTNRYPADEQPYVKKIEQHLAKYSTASNDAVAGAYNLIAKLNSVFEPTRAQFEAKLSAALIASGRLPLQAAMSAARASLRADEVATPLVAGMRQRYERFRRVRARELYFLAKSYASDAEDYAQEAQQSIQNAQLASSLATEALQYIESYRVRVRDEFALLTAQGEAKTVTNGARKMRTHFKNRCVAADPAVNCERLRDMAKISADQIIAMTSEERRAFEDMWSKVGPVPQ